MHKSSYLVCSAALLLAAAACSDSTGLKNEISQADANQLAADFDGVASLS
jgi:type III secretory pathway lipoprotein EscJ